jgi:hypothetical protein
MKVFKLGNLFLASLALALVMLSGCSSTEEPTPTDTSSQSGDNSACEGLDSPVAEEECRRAEEMMN